MSNSLYMPDSHFIDAISVHASIIILATVFLTNDAAFGQLPGLPTTRSPPTLIPNYACSARVLVLVCLCSRACARVLVLVVLVLSCYCARVLVLVYFLVCLCAPSRPSRPSRPH